MNLLTPMDIHNKEFKHSFRGYNEDEIDEFLDRVVNDYEKLFRENDKLKEEVARLQKDADSYQEREKSINDTLLLAQKTSQEVTENARQTAADMKENAVKECENMRQEAEMEAKKKLDEASNKVRAIVAEYDRLVREKNQFLRKVKLTMESELAVLNQTISELPNPEAEEKARPAKPASRPAEPKAAPAREEKPRRERTARKNKNRRNAPSMEVNVIRPSSMEDTREIADTLLDSCTVVLNLEGLDVEIAQRVIDFTCGVCYALDGSLQKISNYIFIITPAEVDISGDYQSILSGAFDLPSMTSPY